MLAGKMKHGLLQVTFGFAKFLFISVLPVNHSMIFCNYLIAYFPKYHMFGTVVIVYVNFDECQQQNRLQ